MEISVVDYYASVLPEKLHFAVIPELSNSSCSYYKMLAEYGSGHYKLISYMGQFLVLTADFTPRDNFEKVSEISQPYIEISQFETETSSWRIGKQKLKSVGRGICCYANKQRTAYAYCEAGKPARFTKILITQDYFDQFVQKRYGSDYSKSVNTISHLTETPNSPELNFIFQQIRDCTAEGAALQIYMESKVLEVLSLVTHHYNQTSQYKHLPVKLDTKDKRSLAKTVTYMKHNPASYPSIKELSKTAGMSESRYQLAFKQTYGTTVYEYLKVLRMNQALLLLRNSDIDIRLIAQKVGYTHAGHFSGLFKKIYGITPKHYRQLHGIK